MCGIAGFCSIPNADQSQLKVAAAILAIEMQSRGTMSWGTFDKDTIHKGLGNISSGLTLPATMPDTFVIHTRWATHGAINEANQHPFDMGEMVGCHNGVISNHSELNAKYGRTFEVDSQHIFQHIKDGDYTLSDIRGYGTIVYRFKGHWFAGRFNRGELSVANTPLGKIFASTSFAVEKACRFAGIPIESWDQLKDNQIYELKPDGMFERFEVHPETTTSRWDDTGFRIKSSEGKTLEWNSRTRSWDELSKKNEGSFSSVLALPPPRSIEIEEHDEPSARIECGLCYGDCVPENHFVNEEEVLVCADCAKSSYSFIHSSEYFINNGRSYHLECGLCGSDMDPIVTMVNEDLMICKDCFETQFTTKGLTKVVPVIH